MVKIPGYWQRLKGVYFGILLPDAMQYVELFTTCCFFVFFTVFPKIRANYDSPSKNDPDNINLSLIASQ